jgi:WD40 repeat protein
VVELSPTSSFMACYLEEDVCLSNADSGAKVCTLQGHLPEESRDSFTSFKFCPKTELDDGTAVVPAMADGEEGSKAVVETLFLTTASRTNYLVRLWKVQVAVEDGVGRFKSCENVSSVKGHTAPVLSMDHTGNDTSASSAAGPDPAAGRFLATGGADRIVRVWEYEKGYCTHR